MRTARAIILVVSALLSLRWSLQRRTRESSARSRVRGRDQAKAAKVTGGGQVRFTETGSGVLSLPMQVMTAAHVVHS